MRKRRVISSILVISVLLTGVTWAQEQAQPGSIQQTCFIMKGNPVNSQIYADYKGHRIYFCCRDCLTQFKQNPEQYLKAMMEAKFPLEKVPETK